MNAQLEGVTFTARMIARLLLIFSLISLLIAAIGQYAVVAFNMRRRVREFGVRIALGASARQVLSTVFGEGFALTAIGLLVGLLSAWESLAVRGVLFGVTPTDAPTDLPASSCCSAGRSRCSAVAWFVHATRGDPVTALRQDFSDGSVVARPPSENAGAALAGLHVWPAPLRCISSDSTPASALPFVLANPRGSDGRGRTSVSFYLFSGFGG